MTKTINHADYPKSLKAKSDAELHHIIADCKAALAAWSDCPNASYYLDEINYAAAELNARRKAA